MTDAEWVRGDVSIPLGADVCCIDVEEPIGRSRYVVLDPVAGQLTHVVVSDRQRPDIGRVAPLGQVGEIAPKRIWLTCTMDEFKRFGPFTVKEYVRAKSPFAGYDPDGVLVLPYILLDIGQMTEDQVCDPMPQRQLAVRRGSRVEATNGSIGTVGEFVVHPVDGRVTHLLLGKGHPWGDQDIAIPLADIDCVRENVVYLRLNKLRIRALPHVRTLRNWT